MTTIGWILLIAGLFLIAASILMAFQVGRDRLTERPQTSSGQWGDKGFVVNSFSALMFMGGLVLVIIGLVFGRTGGTDRASGVSTFPPVVATTGAPSTVTVTETPRTTKPGPSTPRATARAQSSTSIPAPSPSSTTQPTSSSPSTVSRTGPWSVSTNDLQLVVERVVPDPDHPKLMRLSVRVVNDSDTDMDFGLENFLAVDNHGTHYTADENLSTWDGPYLSSGQRLAGQIVLADPLQAGTTLLNVSFKRR